MFKVKTLTALVFSLVMGFLAVKAMSLVKQEPAAAPVPPPRSEAPPAPPKAEPPLPPVKAPEVQSFSQAIPRGMRITTIEVDEVSGVTREIKKNDRVDVVAVTSLSGGSGGKISRIVLQNIVVFDLEQDMQKQHITEKKRKKRWHIHLLVTPGQGAVLSSVTGATQLKLLLRNQGDDQMMDTSPTVYTSGTGVISIDDKGRDPAGAIPPGMRAVTLKIDDSDGICGTLSAGDRVDVIFSCKAARFSTKGGSQAVGARGEIFDVRKSARILLQNVAVLTTGHHLKNLVAPSGPSRFITLSVTPAQAEKLAVITEASKTGTLKLIARNPGDRQRVHTSGEILEDILLKDKRAFRVINVMRGSKVYPEKYYIN